MRQNTNFYEEKKKKKKEVFQVRLEQECCLFTIGLTNKLKEC